MSLTSHIADRGDKFRRLVGVRRGIALCFLALLRRSAAKLAFSVRRQIASRLAEGRRALKACGDMRFMVSAPSVEVSLPHDCSPRSQCVGCLWS